MQCTASNDLLEQRAKSGSFVGAKLTKYRGHRVSLLIYHEHWHQEMMPVIMSAAYLCATTHMRVIVFSGDRICWKRWNFA